MHLQCRAQASAFCRLSQRLHQNLRRLHTGQPVPANAQAGHRAHALRVGLRQGLGVCGYIAPLAQGRFKVGRVQPELLRQLDQHLDAPDVQVVLEKGLQHTVVVVVAPPAVLRVLVTLPGQRGGGLR